MAEIVNFNKYRKAKAKDDKDRTARENRAKFGRTKAEKQRDAQERAAFERGVDLHALEDDENSKNTENADD